MAQDITLQGASYSDVPSVVLPKTGGGTASFTDVTDTTAVASDVAQGKYFYLATGEKVAGTGSGGGTGGITQDADGYLVLSDTGGGGGGGDSWSWMGKNPTLVKTYAKEKVYFKDTDFPSWTWSTSSSDIVAATAYNDTTTIDLTKYNYIIICKLYVYTDYGNWTPVNAVTDYSYITSYITIGTYSTLSAKQSDVYNSASSGTSNSQWWTYYKDSSGNDALMSSYYGLYSSSSSSVSSSGYNDSKVLTISRPKLQARGHAAYFSPDAFNNVNMDNSYYEMVTEVWRVDAPTIERAGIYSMALDVLDNGL